jgi:hypothetical protein
MVVEPGGELVLWRRWSQLISSLRPMGSACQGEGSCGRRRMVDESGRQAVGSLPPRARSTGRRLRWSSTSSIARSASSRQGREGSSARETAVVAGSDFASRVPTGTTWEVLPSRVDAKVSLLAAGRPPQRCSSGHTTSRITAARAGVMSGQGSKTATYRSLLCQLRALGTSTPRGLGSFDWAGRGCSLLTTPIRSWR